MGCPWGDCLQILPCAYFSNIGWVGVEVRVVFWRACDMGINCGIAFDLCKWFGLCRPVGAGLGYPTMAEAGTGGSEQ